MLAPLETLYDAVVGEALPLTPELARLYGPLRLPARLDRPHVFANFVETLDGVVALEPPNPPGGGVISGNNQHDRAVMGLLRAIADVVIVGAGTARLSPDGLWTAEQIYPSLADEYRVLRRRLGFAGPPVTAIVTGHGDLAREIRALRTREVPVVVVTTDVGAERLRARALPAHVKVAPVPRVEPFAERVGARAILAAVQAAVALRPKGRVLVEGGPRLLADFVAEKCLDELFLTLAPQLAGRNESGDRPGLVEGKALAPEVPAWLGLSGAKRAGNHLFLRYSLADSSANPSASSLADSLSGSPAS